ncbi:MAG: amidohydrolase family protein [Thermomicrobiales bacterium]|nr:amidohydrolase family protein [Thermomicrobiales bacterium]
MAMPDVHGPIDCDIHIEVPAISVLFPFLAEHWRAYITETSFKGPIDTSYPPGAETSARPDVRGSTGLDLDVIREQALAPFQTAIGILTCTYAVDSVRNPFAAAALASAVNDWQATNWLSQEPRLRGSIVVPIQDPALAAEEIDRVGGDPRFVQILLPAHAEALYGNRRFYPVYEAALRHDLAIGIHFGGNPGSPPTAVGWPSYYVEEYVGMSHIFQSQVISLITEGAFDRFPTLRVALIESGVTWLPSLMWRLDKEWKGLRKEVPWVRRLPSEYVHEHIRLTTQPLDLPPHGDTPAVLDQLNAAETLMFASDFPHNHSPAAPTAFLEQMPAEVTRRIMRDNAAEFYHLPAS